MDNAMKQKRTIRERWSRPLVGGRRGMTLFEILVVIGVIAVLASIIAPNFLRLARRADIEGAVRVATQRLNEARTEAITRGVDVVVVPDLRAGPDGVFHYLVAWADVDGDGLYSGPINGDGTYVPAAGPYKSVDYPLFEWMLPYAGDGKQYANVYFWSAAEPSPTLAAPSCTDTDTDCGAMTGFTHRDGDFGWADWSRGLVYEPEGSVLDAGGFRLAAGPHGGARNEINFLELNLESAASGRVELRKYVDGIGAYLPKPVYDETVSNYTPPYQWTWH